MISKHIVPLYVQGEYAVIYDTPISHDECSMLLVYFIDNIVNIKGSISQLSKMYVFRNDISGITAYLRKYGV